MKRSISKILSLFFFTSLNMQAVSKDIIYVRHAESEFNTFRYKKILYGLDSALGLGMVKNDADLSELGIAQGLQLREHPFLQKALNEKGTLVLSSNLKRSINTALLAVQGYGFDPRKPNIHVMQALQENGVWLLGLEFIIPDSIPSIKPGEYPVLKPGIQGHDILYPHYQHFPDYLKTYDIPEAFEFEDKVFDLLSFLFENPNPEINQADQVVIFGHSNWLRDFLQWFAPDCRYAKEKIPNSGIITFRTTWQPDGIVSVDQINPRFGDSKP